MEAFSDEEFGRLTRAMIRYNATGEVPEFTGNERFIWPMLQSQMDRDRKAYTEKCESNRRNGKKGGRPKKEEITDGYCEDAEKTDRFFEKPKKPKEKENEKVNEKENENEKVNEKVNEREKKKERESREKREEAFFAAKPPRPHFSPPSIKEIRDYCRQMGYTFDPEGCWDYYTAVGWKIGRNTMTDWKAALRHWNTKEQEYAKRTKRYEPEIPTWTVGVRL